MNEGHEAGPIPAAAAARSAAGGAAQADRDQRFD